MENIQNILTIIADNPVLLKELKNLFEKQFEVPREIKEDRVSITNNEILGQILRARIYGFKAIDEVFREIEKYKTIPEQPEAKNPAR